MLLMSSLPAGFSNAVRAGRNLLSGELPDTVQIVQDWKYYDRQKCRKVHVESDFEQKGPSHAYEP